MPQHEHDLVDLLEVYHARSLRGSIQSEIRRLRREDNLLPGADVSRRRDTLRFYEGMLLTCTALLHALGDEC